MRKKFVVIRFFFVKILPKKKKIVPDFFVLFFLFYYFPFIPFVLANETKTNNPQTNVSYNDIFTKQLQHNHQINTTIGFYKPNEYYFYYYYKKKHLQFNLYNNRGTIGRIRCSVITYNKFQYESTIGNNKYWGCYNT